MWMGTIVAGVGPMISSSRPQDRRSAHSRLLGACLLALLFSAGRVEARVNCESRSAGTICKPTQRDCIRDRADLENCFGHIERVKMAFVTYWHTPGRKCDPWNVTDDTEHVYTPSFRPANVSVTVEVNDSSNGFRIYATWDRVEDANLHNYEVKVKQIQDGSTFKTSYCTNLSKNATEYQNNTWSPLNDDRTVKVQVITSPYDYDTFDCNVHSLTFTVPVAYTGKLMNPHTCVPDIIQDITVHRWQQQVDLSWEALGNKVYFVSVIDPLISSQPNCRQPGENPPCFITNAANITIGPLKSSRKYLVNVDAYPECEGYEIMGVYSGCHDCCHFIEILPEDEPSTATHLDSARVTALPAPVQADLATATTAQKNIPRATIEPQKSIPLATVSSSVVTYTSLITTPIIVSSGSVITFSSRVSLEVPQGDVYKSSDASTLWICIVLILVLLEIAAVLAICGCILVRRSKNRGKNGGRGGKGEGEGRVGEGGGEDDGYQECLPNLDSAIYKQNENDGLQSFVGESASNQLQPSLVQEKIPNKKLSDSTSPAHTAASLRTTCTTHLSSAVLHSYQTAVPSVLVVYSPRCPAEDKEVLLQFLLCDLQSYDIRSTSHDWHLKGNIPMWIEQEMKRSTAVLCVCNQQFQQEWEQQVTADCTIVYALQQLMYASLSQCEDLSSKFAVVLLRQSDRHFIPTQYLQSVKRFYVNEVKEIAHFVKRVPPYECSHSKDL